MYDITSKYARAWVSIIHTCSIYYYHAIMLTWFKSINRRHPKRGKNKNFRWVKQPSWAGPHLNEIISHTLSCLMLAHGLPAQQSGPRSKFLTKPCISTGPLQHRAAPTVRSDRTVHVQPASMNTRPGADGGVGGTDEVDYPSLFFPSSRDCKEEFQKRVH